MKTGGPAFQGQACKPMTNRTKSILARSVLPYQTSRPRQVPKKPKHEVEERWTIHPQEAGPKGRSVQLRGVETCGLVPTVLQPAETRPDHRKPNPEYL